MDLEEFLLLERPDVLFVAEDEFPVLEPTRRAVEPAPPDAVLPLVPDVVLRVADGADTAISEPKPAAINTNIDAATNCFFITFSP
jgi:hypothetical protein